MKDYTPELLELFANGTEKLSVVHITRTDGTVHRFLHSVIGAPLTINGNTYHRRLVEMDGLKESPFSRETNRQEIVISCVQNEDYPGGEFGELTASNLYPLKMAKVESFIYLPATNELLWYWDGYLSNPTADETHVRATVIDQSEAAGFCFATYALSPRNGFVNPDPDDVPAPSGGGGIGGGSIPVGGGHCFVKGTIIRAGFDTEKANQDFKVGDAILSFNKETLELEMDVVEKVISADVGEYIELTFADNRKVGVTSEHPFYTEHKLFTPVSQIPMGTKIYDFSGEKVKLVKLATSRLVKERVEVITFTVTRNHSYIANGFAVGNKYIDPIGNGDDQGRVFAGVVV